MIVKSVKNRDVTYDLLLMAILFIGIMNYGMICLQVLDNNYIFPALTICLVVITFVRTKRMGNILCPINIVNWFSLGVFALRPIHLELLEDPLISSVFSMYYAIYGTCFFSLETYALASLIGFVGLAVVDTVYFWGETPKTGPCLQMSYGKTSREASLERLTIIVVILVTVLLMALFFMKTRYGGSEMHIQDLLWVYLNSAIIVYLICRERGASLTAIALLAISIVLFAIMARRQYIFNLLICFTVSLYLVSKNRRIMKIHLALTAMIMLVVIFVYGLIRDAQIAASSGSFVEEILGEFCMYDMLVASLDWTSGTGLPFFMGYNYLTIFTTVIPGISILPFDHELTALVFCGSFRGGIPATVFGSLYLNFGFVGLVAMCVVFALLLKRLNNIACKYTGFAGIGYYAVLLTFSYDVTRVGDVGRELWSALVFLFVFILFVKCFGMFGVSVDGSNGLSEN